MPRQKITLPSFNSVSAGSTATVNLPTGPRYHYVFIKYKNGAASRAQIEAELQEVRVKINGKVQRTASLKQLFDIYEANGVEFRQGLIPIHFSEPWRRNAAGEDSIAWGTANVDTFQIEVDIAADTEGPKLEAMATVDGLSVNLKNIIKWRRQTVPVSAAGPLTVNTLPRIRGDIYQRMHCFETNAGDIGGIEVNLDRVKSYTQDVQYNDAVLATRDMKKIAGVFPIIFDETQRLEDGLALEDSNGNRVQDFEIVWSMTEGNPFTLITEVRGQPD